MTDISTSDIKNSRDALSGDPVTAAIGGAAGGHVVAHMVVATCGAVCLPYIITGAVIAGVFSLLFNDD